MIPGVLGGEPLDYTNFRQLTRLAVRHAARLGTFAESNLIATIEPPAGTLGEPGVRRIYRITCSNVTGIDGDKVKYKGNPSLGTKIEGYQIRDLGAEGQGVLELDPFELPRETEAELTGDTWGRQAKRIRTREGLRLIAELSSAVSIEPQVLDQAKADWEEN